MASYVVQPGDRLWDIAQRYLGDGNRWREIAPPGLTDPTKLQPGTRLTLPDGGTPQPAQPFETTTYTVRSGDTLGALARRYNTTAAELARLNGIANPDLIRPGQQLRLPQQRAQAPATAPMPRPRPEPTAQPSSPAPATASAPPFVPPGQPAQPAAQPRDFAAMSVPELLDLVRNGDLSPEDLRTVSQIAEAKRQQAEAEMVVQQPRIDAADRQHAAVAASAPAPADATRFASPLRNDPGAMPFPATEMAAETPSALPGGMMPGAPSPPSSPLAFALSGRPPEPQPPTNQIDMLVEALMSGQIGPQDIPPEARALLIEMLMGGGQGGPAQIGTAF